MQTVESHAGSAQTLPAAMAIVFNALVWGVSWWPLRELQAYGLHPLWATALMYLLVVMVVLAFKFNAIQGFIAHPQLWLLGAAAGFTNVGFNWAVTIGDVVRVVLLFYLMPAWSVVVAWVMLGQRPTAGSLLRLALAMTGVLIVLKAPDSPWPIPSGAADWLALMGGFGFAITNALLHKLGHTPSASRMLAMFGGSGLVAALVAGVGMTQQLVPAPSLALAGVPLLLGLSLAFMASNGALQFGAAHLAVGTTAILMLTEILFASVSSALLGAADLSPRVLTGGALIVVAAVLAAIASARER